MLFLSACLPNKQALITIIDGENILRIESSERVPSMLLTEAGIASQPNDRLLLNGSAVPIDQPIAEKNSIQLQLRRAVTLTLVTPQGEQVFQTSALTVGQTLNEAGYSVNVNDKIDPPAETAITGSMTVTYTPARDLIVYCGEDVIKIRSAAGTIGEALAEAGIPLMGLDTSSPLENEAPPPDGQIRVVRVQESISITLEPIPFEVKVVDSPDVPFGQQETLQPGVTGLAMVRTRIRHEDGKRQAVRPRLKQSFANHRNVLWRAGRKSCLRRREAKSLTSIGMRRKCMPRFTRPAPLARVDVHTEPQAAHRPAMALWQWIIRSIVTWLA